jgi:hypothetical protein
MTTFSGLFDYPDLSDDQLQLFSLSNSSESKVSGEQEDEEDLWYDQPFDSEDSKDKSVDPCFTLPPGTSTAFIMPKRPCKEYSTGARIKVICMLEEKKSVGRILEATGFSR